MTVEATSSVDRCRPAVAGLDLDRRGAGRVLLTLVSTHPVRAPGVAKVPRADGPGRDVIAPGPGRNHAAHARGRAADAPARSRSAMAGAVRAAQQRRGPTGRSASGRTCREGRAQDGWTRAAGQGWELASGLIASGPSPEIPTSARNPCATSSRATARTLTGMFAVRSWQWPCRNVRPRPEVRKGAPTFAARSISDRTKLDQALTRSGTRIRDLSQRPELTSLDAIPCVCKRQTRSRTKSP